MLVRRVRIVRLIDPPLAPGDSDLLRIDNATPEAIDALGRLAEDAARLNIAAAEDGAGGLAGLPSFFESTDDQRVNAAPH
jgi:hypothetical protein